MQLFTVKNTTYVLFEPDLEELQRIAAEAGFQAAIQKQKRALLISLLPGQQQSMFFDAADPSQVGRLAAARTFVSGSTGTVFNTPLALESLNGPGIGVRVATEVRQDLTHRFPHGPSDASLMELFQQLVEDLAAGMVGVCGLPPQNQPPSHPSA